MQEMELCNEGAVFSKSLYSYPNKFYLANLVKILLSGIEVLAFLVFLQGEASQHT